MWSRPTEGGIGRHIVTLIDGLKNDFDISVACLHQSRLEELILSMGITILPLPLGGTLSPREDYRSFKLLVGFMRSQGIDLVHSHGAKAALIARPAALVAGVPASVYTVHNSVFNEKWPSWKNGLATTIEHILSWPTDCIVTVSNALRHEIMTREKINRSKIKVIYNGISLNSLHFTPNISQWNLPPRRTVVGTVARMAPQKGLSVLLQAAEQLLRKYRNIHFILAGDGPLKDSLMEQVRSLSMENRFTFTGAVNNISTIYAAMDIFVLSSLTEGLPLSLLEAMAFSLPVVASAVGGVPEVIEHGVSGLLVAPGNATELAHGIAYLLDNPGRAGEMGKKAHQRVVQHFDASKMVEQTAYLYYNLLREKGALPNEKEVI
jgi:glycosyltransferase involved in cell wall biosynthesis